MFPNFIISGNRGGERVEKMRKKVLTAIIAGIMVAGLTACTKDDLKTESTTELKSQVESTENTAIEAETTAETETTEQVTTQAVDTEEKLTTEGAQIQGETAPTESKASDKKKDSEAVISEEEAAKLLEDTFGTKDEQTGNTFSFGYVDTVTVDAADYHVFVWSWLVDNDHLSRLGVLFVCTDGKAIYEGNYNGETSELFAEKNFLEE